jgi:hypothetical protein
MSGFFAFALLIPIAAAQPLPDMVLPVTAFSPMQQADGSRAWRFVVNPRGADETVIMILLADEIGKARWCEAGWEITSRTKTMGNIVITGRCKSL